MNDSKPPTPPASMPEMPPPQQPGTLPPGFNLKEWTKAVGQELRDNLNGQVLAEQEARKRNGQG